MSFGFSISDFVCCGQLAWQLYTEFQEAPGACQAFAKELLLFHQVIGTIESLIGRRDRLLNEAEQATLGLCLDMCKDILFVQIVGVDSAPVCLYTERLVQSTGGVLKLQFVAAPLKTYDHKIPPEYVSPDLMILLRQRLRERNFAKRIPKIRAAMSTAIEKLTSFQVLLIR